MKHYVLPTSAVAHRLLDGSRDYAVLYPDSVIAQLVESPTRSFNSKGISLKTCVQLAIAIVNEIVASRSAWQPRLEGDLIDKQMAEMVYNWTETDNEQPIVADAGRFYIDVIDDCYTMVEEMITNKIIPDNDWHIWYVRRMGHDVLLERGEDYRIHDWKRRMENEEWARNEPDAERSDELLNQKLYVDLTAAPSLAERLDRARIRSRRFRKQNPSEGAL